MGDLQRLGDAELEATLGNHGLEIAARARGVDRAPVRSQPHPTSVSRERILDGTGEGPESPTEALSALAGALEGALARHDLLARRVALRVRLAEGGEQTRSITLAEGLRSAAEIDTQVQALLERCDLGGRPVRGFRIALAGLAPAGAEDRQLDLFG